MFFLFLKTYNFNRNCFQEFSCSFLSQFNKLFQHMPYTHQVTDPIVILISMVVQISPDSSQLSTRPGVEDTKKSEGLFFFYALHWKKNKKLCSIWTWPSQRKRPNLLPATSLLSRLLQYGLLTLIQAKWWRPISVLKTKFQRPWILPHHFCVSAWNPNSCFLLEVLMHRTSECIERGGRTHVSVFYHFLQVLGEKRHLLRSFTRTEKNTKLCLT